MKKLFLLGSSGSIGQSTLDVVRKFPERFKVEALTVNNNVSVLQAQIKEFRPKIIAVGDENAFKDIDPDLLQNIEVYTGTEGLAEAAGNAEYDILVTAVVGFAGLAPTIEGIKRGKRIALANKETLVVAGEIVNKLCKEYNSELIPVDSEHSAIFQCLTGENTAEIKKLIITASGGPFLNLTREELAEVSVEDALKHPNWEMGNKITIDSATMMNKGLEVIEAHWLFEPGRDNIEVVVHPQSIIHSMVEFIDGSIKAQLSVPDMKLPIQYALSYPDRLPADFVETDLSSIKNLTFFEPDFNKFTCLKLAFAVMEEGGTMPCVLNAANEIAVEKFLKQEIPFLGIPEMIESALNKFENKLNPDLDSIVECDSMVRKFTRNYNIKGVRT